MSACNQNGQEKYQWTFATHSQAFQDLIQTNWLWAQSVEQRPFQIAAPLTARLRRCLGVVSHFGVAQRKNKKMEPLSNCLVPLLAPGQRRCPVRPTSKYIPDVDVSEGVLQNARFTVTYGGHFGRWFTAGRLLTIFRPNKSVAQPSHFHRNEFIALADRCRRFHFSLHFSDLSSRSVTARCNKLNSQNGQHQERICKEGRCQPFVQHSDVSQRKVEILEAGQCVDIRRKWAHVPRFGGLSPSCRQPVNFAA